MIMTCFLLFILMKKHIHKRAPPTRRRSHLMMYILQHKKHCGRNTNSYKFVAWPNRQMYVHWIMN